ncbi:putative integral membrane protein [hydrothermal vent metagenome]|uniref:Putative integral membrane protein n=1 Tax=hydrothermal vent metagenome TaxID=652676 RepID=A0A1W1D4E3_9ZZZZ
MKQKLIAFIHSLTVYDYLIFGGSLIVFLLFLLLAVILRKRVGLALFFVFFGMGVLFLGPTLGRGIIYDYMYKKSIKLLSYKRLHFNDALIVKGVLKNESKRYFKKCQIDVIITKTSHNKLKNYIYQWKVLQKDSSFEYDIAPNQTRKLKMIVEPFIYQKDYNVSLEADCR